MGTKNVSRVATILFAAGDTETCPQGSIVRGGNKGTSMQRSHFIFRKNRENKFTAPDYILLCNDVLILFPLSKRAIIVRSVEGSLDPSPLEHARMRKR
jgi:hypothetical protein